MADVTATLNQIVGGLEAMTSQLLAQVGDDRTYAEVWGWNQPAVNRQDMAALVRRPGQMILQIPDSAKDVDQAILDRLMLLNTRISWVTANTVPQLPGGNAFHSYVTIKSLIDTLEDAIAPLLPPKFDLEQLESNKLLPPAQVRRLRGIDRTISELLDDAGALEGKIAVLNEAHATAESLPQDLRVLRQAQNSLMAAVQSAQTNQAGTETARAKAEEVLQAIQSLESEASKLVQSTENAFSAATTKGLGEDFDKRARELSNSVWTLGGILGVTLLIGGIIAYCRIDQINDLIRTPGFSMQMLWANVILSVVSVAAPVWFAWLLTKQIGQRFRLAEDYAFKASVAKAYAGYSQEAARVDPEFRKRLYSTALDRIDEEPLRHVETDNHGSPLHELLGRRRTRPAKSSMQSPASEQAGAESPSE